jgi:hypothetical protein
MYDEILKYLDLTDEQTQRFMKRAEQLSNFKLSRLDRHHVLIGVANRIKRERETC